MQDFLYHVKEECKKHGVKFRLSPYKRLKSGGYCTGYFSPDPPELAVAEKSKEFWSVLVHEFCHMQQWIEKTPVWTNDTTKGGFESWELMVGYMNGEKYPQEDIDEAFEIIIRCERDCDMRSVKMIKKYNLPIDTKKYIKQSNAYHYFYHVVKEKKKWYGKQPIYSKKNVLDACPDNFRTNPVKGIPKEIREEIVKHIK